MMMKCSWYFQNWSIHHLAGCSPVPGYPPRLAWSGLSGLGHPPGSRCSPNAVPSIGISWPHAWQRTLFPLWISKLYLENQAIHYVVMLLDNGELLSQLRVSLAKMPSPGCNGRPIACAWPFPATGCLSCMITFIGMSSWTWLWPLPASACAFLRAIMLTSAVSIQLALTKPALAGESNAFAKILSQVFHQ